MRAIVHIGTEKTGTTTIQRFLDLNRPLLQEHSIFFPVSPGKDNQMNLAAFAEDDNKRDDIRIRLKIGGQDDLDAFRKSFSEQLGAEIASTTCDTVVFSNEHCSSRLMNVEEIARLRDLLSPHFSSIEIVVYLRRQDEFLLSSYSTMVKCGHTAPLSLPGEHVTRSRYDYQLLLSRWSEVFGRTHISCQLYERGSLSGGNVVTDFMHRIGLEADERLAMPERQNESLDIASLEFLRELNKHVPYIRGGHLFKLRGDLVARLQKNASGALPTLRPAQLEKFMARFSKGNESVANEYFGGRLHSEGDALFGLPTAREERQPMAPITIETATQIFADLWLEKQKQVDELTARLANKGSKS